MFSFKKSIKTKTKFLSVFGKKIFHSCEDIICIFDQLSYPYSIKTFDYGIVLFSEMVVGVCNPLGVKRFQIAKFKGYFYITRRDLV